MLVRVALEMDAVIGVYSNYVHQYYNRSCDYGLAYKLLTSHSSHCWSKLLVIGESYLSFFTPQHRRLFLTLNARMFNDNNLYQFAYVLEDYSKLGSSKLTKLIYKPNNNIKIPKQDE